MKYDVDSQTGYDQRKKVIIWGAGEATKDFLSYHDFFDDIIEIVVITDSDERKWGGKLEGYDIVSPGKAYGLQYDRFIVPSGQYFEEIADRIASDTDIDRSRIENIYYVTKCKLDARYRRHADKADVLSYLRKNPLDVFNYEFVKKYDSITPEIGYDDTAKLYYVMHNSNKMYMAKRFDTEEKVHNYYKSLCIEQDESSPHLYLQGDFDVKPGDIVVDVGAAEGIFALNVIGRAGKVYLIETDEEWIKALQCTFRDYQDKIQIINKFVSDYTAYNTTTLDDLNLGNVDFIKMDIEGCEYAAMVGAKTLIQKASHIRCSLCAYHNDNDEVILKTLAESLGLKVSFSEGYMLFPCSLQQIYIMPTLRRGIIRCEK